MKKLISLLFLVMFLMGTTYLNAQELKFFVTKFEQDKFDMTAKEMAKDDGDGSLYAIIKVTSDIEDDDLSQFKFDFGYMKSLTEIHDGQLWVYVQRNAKNVTIRRNGYKTLLKYSLNQTIQAGCTYVMRLSVQKPKVMQRVLQFKVTPPEENAIVKVKPESSDENFELWGNVDVNGSIDRLMNTGIYLYEVSAENYASSQGRVQLVNGTGNFVENVSLTPNFGYLEVNNTYGIAGAEVYVNDRKVGTVPYKSGRMTCGEDYRLMVSNGELYKTYNATFAIRRGETTTLSPRLESDFAETTIKVDGGAEIFVNGESKGHGSWTGPLRAGTHNVKCRLEGHSSTETQITVQPNVSETFAVDAPTPIEGSLYVRSIPSGASIFIDDSRTSSYDTPQNISNLLVGYHEVKLSLDGYKTEIRTVEIKQDETTSIEVRLMADPSGNSPIEQPTKTKRQYQNKNQFYIQPMIQAGFNNGAGASIGGFIYNYNIELDFLYWYVEDKDSPIFVGGKIGYGFRAGRRFRFTPQWGIGYDLDEAWNSSLGVRADMALTRHIGIVFAPEYSFSIVKSRYGGAPTGLNARIGLNIFF